MPRVKKTEKLPKIASKQKKENLLQATVYDVDGKEVDKMVLPKEIFSVEVNPKLLAQYLRVYLINQRQGTASTKTRSEVTGSTRKIYRQKGTGKARHGDIKAPIFVGGGIVGGPKPKEYSLKINKKQKRKALFYALSLKAREGIIGLINQFLKIQPKTKIIIDFFKKIDLDGKKILIILPELKKNNLVLAARNISYVDLIDAKSINPYLILKSEKIIFVKSALEILTKHFLGKNAD